MARRPALYSPLRSRGKSAASGAAARGLDSGGGNTRARLFTVVGRQSETPESTFILFKTQYERYVMMPLIILQVPLSVSGQCVLKVGVPTRSQVEYLAGLYFKNNKSQN